MAFGAVGYLIVVWYYTTAFAPLTWNFGRTLLWHLCLTCISIGGLHSSTLRLALLVLGPINAAIYATVGFLLGKLLLARKEGRRRRSQGHVAPQ
jgi:hypothetical protein